MLGSVRARLTLWHGTVLAVLLIGFATGAYIFVVRTSRTRTDAALRDALSNLRTQLVAERPQQHDTRAAAEEVLREIHLREMSFVVFDSVGLPVAASVVSPAHDPDEDPDAPLDIAALGRFARGASTQPSVVALPAQEGGYRAAIASVAMPEGRFVAAVSVCAPAPRRIRRVR